jgi:hypothetical protein
MKQAITDNHFAFHYSFINDVGKYLSRIVVPVCSSEEVKQSGFGPKGSFIMFLV